MWNELLMPTTSNKLSSKLGFSNLDEFEEPQISAPALQYTIRYETQRERERERESERERMFK